MFCYFIQGHDRQHHLHEPRANLVETSSHYAKLKCSSINSLLAQKDKIMQHLTA